MKEFKEYLSLREECIHSVDIDRLNEVEDLIFKELNVPKVKANIDEIRKNIFFEEIKQCNLIQHLDEITELSLNKVIDQLDPYSKVKNTLILMEYPLHTYNQRIAHMFYTKELSFVELEKLLSRDELFLKTMGYMLEIPNI
jgi:hypothetical protein